MDATVTHHHHATRTNPAPLLGSLPALALSGSARAPRILSRILFIIFLLILAAIFFMPWQQFVSGTGRVIAFNPLDRRVNVEAPVAGRVKHLHVVENQRVKKGDILLEIQDNDPNLLANMRLQHDAAIARKAAAQQRIEDLGAQIAQMELAKSQAIDSARQRVLSEQYSLNTNQLNFERVEKLLKPGYVSQRDFELAKLAIDSSEANLQSAKAILERTEREMDASISSIKGSRSSAQSDLASADRDITTIDIQINQAQQQVIEAPRDGIVFSITATDGTYLRPGSAICVIIPETESRFVEMWVNGMDMPLITQRHENPDGTVTPGSPVRLQFEGWPAIQFVGWPSVAVGTFGGEVVFIDPTDDGYGRFRIVVSAKPDVTTRDGKTHVEDWPGNRFLRQGVRSKGWVLLQQVPLWLEIWRQLNGFPPVVANAEPGKDKGATMPASTK
ncbi:MAG: HlyD family efflux transporter periplasmic adaptor subunit [Verrucomicrobiaceae bacterium]|jgi:multidrug resistance efflux pump|nr:HlyD family efflux transporter periplasmic adaptor subunit [Verrucomicrobiaceae bacterium]